MIKGLSPCEHVEAHKVTTLFRIYVTRLRLIRVIARYEVAEIFDLTG